MDLREQEDFSHGLVSASDSYEGGGTFQATEWEEGFEEKLMPLLLQDDKNSLSFYASAPLTLRDDVTAFYKKYVQASKKKSSN